MYVIHVTLFDQSCFQACTELQGTSAHYPEGLHVWTHISEWECVTLQPLSSQPLSMKSPESHMELVWENSKTNISAWKSGAIHVENTDKDVKRAFGDKDQCYCLCAVSINTKSLQQDTQEIPVLLLTRLSEESPALLFMCERKPLEKVWTQFSRLLPEVMSNCTLCLNCGPWLRKNSHPPG